jgi:hypothetical protein
MLGNGINNAMGDYKIHRFSSDQTKPPNSKESGGKI